MDFVSFGIIIDDIVFPDGRTVMGVLGGGGPQAAFGMRLWSDSVGLVAGVGTDLPESARTWIKESGVDDAGIRATDLPTPRAWQVTEADGRRTQVWRASGEAIGAQLSRSVNRLPDHYRRARGFHFGVHPDEPDLEFAADLRRMGGVVSMEAFKPADRRPAPESLHALVAAPHIFSANMIEAQSLVGPGEARGLIRRIVEAGAWIAALRLGTEGSLVIEGTTGKGARIPAVPVEVVDTVGAGNAYCGGFLVGWAQSHSVVTAGLYGAVAASFLVQQVGVPVVTDEIRAEARRRVDALRASAEPILL